LVLSILETEDVRACLQLKSEFIEVKKLREQSGFGWDDARKMVTATADVWEKYLAVGLCYMCISEHFLMPAYCVTKAHPKAKPWRKKAFPLYDDMLELVEGIVATGETAFRPG
jgi:hypothetical protein